VRYLLLPALAFAAIVLLAACDNGGDVGITPGATVSPGPGEPSPTPAPAPDVCQPNPDPASADVAEVDSPGDNDSFTSPVTVSGRIVAFEAQFNIAIFDADGRRIVHVTARSEEGQVLAPFSEDVPFSVTEDTPACIWVYDVSQADGVTPVNVVQVPVVLKPGGLSQLCQPNPDPATSDLLVIDQPSADDSVTSPVTISGQILAFEAQFRITIFDTEGDQVADVSAMSDEGQVLSPFSEDVTFSVTEETPACIWVYDLSEADGSPINVGQIPVTLSP
jgi:hypothetical protein